MTGFDHAVLMVGNWERARDWYSRALNFVLRFEHPER